MKISLSAAEQISDVTVFGFGFALVFVGLICIIAICSIVGALCKRFIKEDGQPAKEAVKPANVPKASANNKNKGEIVAAISAAIAEELGIDVSGIRICSIKKLS